MKLTEELKKNIIEDIKLGLNYKEIKEKYKISIKSYYKVKNEYENNISNNNISNNNVSINTDENNKMESENNNE
jgi:transposase